MLNKIWQNFSENLRLSALTFTAVMGIHSTSGAGEITSSDISKALAAPSTIVDVDISPMKPTGLIKKNQPVDINLQGMALPQWRKVIEVENFPTFSFEIKFQKSSDDVVPGDEYILEKIAEALKTPQLINSTILIAGHTDASGSKNYNLRLSQQRSDKIKSMLQFNYGITSKRLISVGFGELMPISGINPEDARNRRVELFNVSNLR